MDRLATEELSFARCLIGCAGWSLSSAVSGYFPSEGTHLERYARVFPAVELNSSFYRPHKPATYARWRDSVPEAFRFSVKVPKAITHELRLRDATELLGRFMGEVGPLDAKLGCLLVQLPPSLQLDVEVARVFFSELRERTRVDVVCEPRHRTWFTHEARELLEDFDIAYVKADPPGVRGAQVPDARVVYYRLHGSPKMYFSAYSEPYLDALAERIAEHERAGRRVWCIFDNTAEGAAIPNALSLLHRDAQHAHVT
ncbi:DUF72 domain-containing protein [Pyxidicoccus parkwayensis]|uniref:DUF72 domain-containing protein n=1 Tax=Pyxidicoccus parkwayensis TaxID=2813578 RepID=A0ABX7P0D4_9BACT|nr:DUF72 domain-containing protein [Pyxidicoccus parkwaysis]QSQ24627.1 DUF72 domain-containing protein [Pyxidicoccus parkwaysis]